MQLLYFSSGVTISRITDNDDDENIDAKLMFLYDHFLTTAAMKRRGRCQMMCMWDGVL